MKNRILNLFATLIASLGAANAATITVNTADNADFSAGKTNLVYALTNINDGDTIAFNIPGAGPHYLQTPVNGYPVLIKDRVTVDGYSQPGASANSNPITTSNNAVIKIVLDSRNGNYRDMEYTLFTLANSSPPIDNTSIATERGGYGLSNGAQERAVLGIYRATNVNIRGLAFLGTFEISAYGIAVGHDYGLDTSVKDRLAYDAGSSRNCHINGCWFGIDPTNQTVAGLAPFQDGIAFFRHRDVSGGPRPELPNESLLVGVKAGSANPRAEFNVFAYQFYCIAGEAVRTRISGNFAGVFPDGVTPTGVPVQFGAGFEIGRYDDTEPIVVGTDGDGVNDADEGNLFGPLENGGAVLGFYSTGDKLYLVSGNRFGLGVDGSRWTNSQVVFDAIANTTKVQFGSDFNGVSDAWEGNVIYNNSPFEVVFPTPATTLPPNVLVSSPGARVSFRGNTTVNNGLVPFSYADGAGGRLAAFTNYSAPYMDTSGDILPVLATTNVFPHLSGSFPVGINDYTNIIVDVYELDPEGWANGQAFNLTELLNPNTSGYYGFAQGRKYLGSYPVANTGYFNITIPANSGVVTVTINYSIDPPGTKNGRVHTGNFSFPGYMIPGGVASVGLTHVVPDVIVWYNQTGGYVTNGPINNLADQAVNLANWEPNISVLGESTFLVQANTFANDLTPPANQNNTVILQPAAGGPAKVSYAFSTDAGVQFKGQINLSRQNGNPGRVAGDKRVGAVNYITAAETSLGQLPEFKSDTRWNNNPIYMDVNRYVAAQPFSLDTATLTPTPLAKAWDFVYGPLVTAVAPFTQPEVSRTGGTVAALDNGNFVIVLHDKTGYSDPAGNVTTFAIITPTGTIVKTNTLVDPRDIWDNVAAFKGGFVVRCHDTLYFYDNAGNLQGSVNNNTSAGLSLDTGRGDGIRTASDIRSDYVFVAGRSPNAGTGPVWVAAWDARTRAFVGKVQVDDQAEGFANDRASLAVDAQNRVCVAWVHKPTLDFQNQVAARVFSFDGTSFTPLTHSFFPFVNYDPDGTLSPNGDGITTIQPSVAMTTRQICIAAKGVLNGQNNAAAGGNTAAETTVYTVISHPASVSSTPPAIKATKSGNNLVISWDAALGSFTLQSSAVVTGGWSNVVPQPPIVPVAGQNTMTVAIGSGNTFFRLAN